MDERKKNKSIEFRLAPGLTMGTRMIVIVVLVVAGFMIQHAFSVLIGWLLVLVGSLFGVVRGGTTKPVVPQDKQWQATTIEELEEIGRLSARIEGWKGLTGTWHSGSWPGCGLLFLALLVIAGSTVLVLMVVDLETGAEALYHHYLFGPPLKGGLFSVIWLLDLLTMLIPIWLAGSLTAWEPPDLKAKADLLLHIYREHKSNPNLEFLPSLQVAKKEDSDIPTDCRMLVKLKDAPPDFIGIQVQVSMNSVQSTKYPYCYSVIIAKKGFGLTEKAQASIGAPEEEGVLERLFGASGGADASLPTFDGSVIEVEGESDVDVVVVRQKTTKRGGYSTDENQADEVFADALRLSEQIVKG